MQLFLRTYSLAHSSHVHLQPGAATYDHMDRAHHLQQQACCSYPPRSPPFHVSSGSHFSQAADLTMSQPCAGPGTESDGTVNVSTWPPPAVVRFDLNASVW